MASFCSGCGFPQNAGVAFCPNCGVRQQGAASAAALPQSVPQVVASAPAKAGSGLKIILALVALFAVAGLAAIGGLYYVAHRVKEAVVDRAKAYGVELPSTTPVQTSATPRHIPKGCGVLSAAEASGLLGQPIERAEPQANGCSYFGPPGLSAKLADQLGQDTFGKLKTQGADGVKESDIANALMQMGDSAQNGAGFDNSHGELPLLTVVFDEDGKPAMTALTMTKSLFNGIGKAAGAKEGPMGAEIPGLGDRAIRLQRVGLSVLKGDLMIRIWAGPVSDPVEKTVAVARAVLKKLD